MLAVLTDPRVQTCVPHSRLVEQGLPSIIIPYRAICVADHAAALFGVCLLCVPEPLNTCLDTILPDSDDEIDGKVDIRVLTNVLFSYILSQGVAKGCLCPSSLMFYR
jgi:hypothetical protein